MMAEWRQLTLGNLFEIKHGFAFKGEFFSDDGELVLLTPGNFREEGGLKLKGDKEKYYTGDFPEEYLLCRGDLLVAMTDLTQNAPILGSPAFIPQDGRFLHNQRLGKIVNLKQEEIVPEFLFYLLNTAAVRGQIKGSATGATVRHTSPSRIYEVSIELPPLPAQRRIAGILSAYDELIENSQHRIRILESMARALYREWFVHFRFPSYEEHPRIASSLGHIPKDWEVKTVEDVVQRIPSGKKYEQKTVSSTGAIPVLDQGKSGIIGYHDDEPGVVASEDAPVIVFANHTCYQRLIHFPFSAIQNVLPFVSSSSLPRNIYWLHWATNGLVVFNDYKGHWPEFMAKNLVVPPAELCQRFGDFAAPISHQILKLERQVQNLRRTRDLLLPRLLSGQVELETEAA